MPRQRHVPLTAALFLLGCTPQTGLLVEVAGPGGGITSVAAGVTTLDFVVAHPSYCERWIGDATANHTRINVKNRDLSKQPYDFLIKPTHQTDLSEPVYVAALAYADNGQLLGEASFGAHPLAQGQVLRRRARIALFGAAGRPGGPKYVTSDGCVCVPGEPWVGTGSGTGCDLQVVTSFARLGDTAGCELVPKGAPLPVPACDGQLFGSELDSRALPCWADDGTGMCRVGSRACIDQLGEAYGSECSTSADAPALPSATLCARYRQCQQDPCGNLIACFERAFPTSRTVKCTLRVNPSTKPMEPIVPCAGGSWKTTLPGGPATGTACVAALIEGTAQPPFTIGFGAAMSMPMTTDAQPIATACPTTLQVDQIDVPYPMALPARQTFEAVIGEELVHISLETVQACDGSASLVCTAE